MAFFKMRDSVAPHSARVNGEIVTYKAGDVVESDLDLDKSFSSKFYRITDVVEDTVKATPAAKAKAKAAEEAKTEEEEFEESPRDPLGEDVSIEYPDAVDLDLLVFAATRGNSTRFFVTNSEDPFKSLHEKPLSKRNLKSFLKKQGS